MSQPKIPPPDVGTRDVVLKVVLTALVALAASSYAIAGGAYGFALFLGVPFLIGFFSVALYGQSGPRPLWRCLSIAVASAFALSLGFLALGAEGGLCIVMALPITLPGVLLGALIGWFFLHRARRVRPLSAAGLGVILLFGAIAAERNVTWTAPVYEVHDTLDVAASPEVVWDVIVNLGELPPPEDWMLRTGVACPQRVELGGSGVGARRLCTLSTGQMDERITAWQPGRRLAWDVLANPPPLREVNPFRETDPPHLHGFYESLRGEFELEALGGDRTRVGRRTWYQHNTYPAAYWRLWCDLIARRAHLFVLGEVKALAERPSPTEQAALRR